MATAVELLSFTVVFLIGFICGKLFAALQFAGMKAAARSDSPGLQAKSSVNRLLRLGRKL